jgi:predicted permease
LLFSEQFKEECRKKSKYFTRKRILTFPVLIGFLLNLLTKSLQIELEKFLKVLKGPATEVSVTKQAFCQARQNFSERAFIRLE